MLALCQLQLLIEIKRIEKKQIAALALVALTISNYNCQSAIAGIHSQTSDEPKSIAKVAQPQWSEIERHAIAKTLAGECYDDKELDKRRVCEVILNRVSNKNFADTILEVLTTSGAFNGYWKQSRLISKSDYAIAEQALQDWYEGGCKPLSKWLFFSKGSNRENVFRSDF